MYCSQRIRKMCFAYLFGRLDYKQKWKIFLFRSGLKESDTCIFQSELPLFEIYKININLKAKKKLKKNKHSNEIII